MTQRVDEVLGQLSVQKQRLQRERVELESALEELKNTTESYKLIGNLMLKKPTKQLREDLTKQLEQVTKRLESVEQQAGALRKQVEE